MLWAFRILEWYFFNHDRIQKINANLVIYRCKISIYFIVLLHIVVSDQTSKCVLCTHIGIFSDKITKGNVIIFNKGVYRLILEGRIWRVNYAYIMFWGRKLI